MEHSAFLTDAALLELCARRGARLDLRDGKLLIRAAPNSLSDDERLLLRRRRHSLMRTLARRRDADRVQTAWAERKVAVPDVCPLTPWQEIFALLTRQGEHAVVNQTAVLDLSLPYADPEGRLAGQALQLLMERHPMLRMQVTENGERAGLQILPSCPLPLRVVRAESEEEREAAVEACRKEFRSRACDLSEAPLWRAAVFPAADKNTGILVLGLHHIIMDGWSMGILVRDLAHLLTSLTEGTAPDAPAAVTYAEYAAWLDQTGLSLIRQTQTAWWSERVHGVPQRHRIWTDFLRGTQPAHGLQHGRHTLCRQHLGAEVMQRLQQTAARLDASLFAALHTALRRLLWVTAGQTHAPVLTVAANRQLAGCEDVVGCFVNVLPLVAPYDPAAPAADSIRQSQACLMEAMEHQMLPFQDIVAAARVRRQHVRHPLSQIFLTLQNAFPAGEESCVTPRLPAEPISAYDLAFLVWDYGDRGCVLHLEYDSSLFRHDRMQALLEGFCACIRELCDCENASAREQESLAGAASQDKTSRDSARQDLTDTAEERLARALHLARYNTVVFEEPTPLDNLLTRACAISGCTCLTPSSASSAQPRLPVLRILTHWPEAETQDVQARAHLLLVNHLPPARQLVTFGAAAGEIRFLLQVPQSGEVLAADAADLASDRDTTLPATVVLPASLAAEWTSSGAGPGSGSGQAPATSLHCAPHGQKGGKGTVALPLPGGTSPLLWRHGHAVHLDELAMQAACVRSPEEADLALGLLVPAHASALDSVVHEDGELVAWTGQGFVLDDAHLARLPEALRPRHVMPVDHVPRRSDGTVCRESLLDIPFYSEEFVRRGLAGAWLRSTNLSQHGENWLHVPTGRPWSMTGLPVDGKKRPGQTCLFARDRCCLVHLSGTELDSHCLRLLLHSCEGSFVLAGENAAGMCSHMNSPRLAPWQPSAAAPVHSAVQIVPETGPPPHDVPDACAGCPCLSWIVFVTQSRTAGCAARRAGLFAALCAQARSRNAASPHSALVLGMPGWSNDDCPGQGQDQGLSLQRAGELLHTALGSGQDLGLIGLEPQDIGWNSLHFRTPVPCRELVCTQPVSPKTLPYPLRTAFCETGPLHMEGQAACQDNTMCCPGAQKAPAQSVAAHREGDTGRHAVTRTMAAIWNGILQTKAADPNASFFDLGGTSVMAPLIQQRIAAAFQVDIGIAGVFLYPSLHELTMVVLTALENRQTRQEDAPSSGHMQARQAAARAARTSRKQERKNHVAPLA